MRAVGYIRISDEEKHDTSRSLPAQRARIEDYCREKGWELLHIYEDAKTGRKDSRVEYQRMLGRIRQGGIGAVVVRWIDRFGRNPRETLTRLWELKDTGVSIVTTDESIEDELMLLVKVGIAGFESKRAAERIEGALAHMHEQGLWTMDEPMGYRVDQRPDSPTKGRLVLIPEEAQWVRRVFAEVCEGRALNAIAADLYRDGYRGKHGGIPDVKSIDLIIRNPAYLGHSVRKGVWVYNTHQPIITPDIWHAAQLARDRRRRNRSPRDPDTPFPLAGLLKCGRCAANGRTRWLYATVLRDKRRPKVYERRVYRCTGIVSHECDLPAISANKVERWLVEQSRTWKLPNERHEGPDPGQRIAELRRALDAVRERQRRAYRGYIDGYASDDDYARESRELRVEADRLQAQLADVESLAARQQASDLGWLERFAEFWEHATDQERRVALGRIVECIEVYGTDDYRIVWRPGIAPQ